MSTGEQKRKEKTKKIGGDWPQIHILVVFNVTTFSFVLTVSNSAIFTRGKKKGTYFEEKNIDGHSDQPYHGGDSQVMLILKDKEKKLLNHR